MDASQMIYTIGHSNHPWPVFLSLLQQHGISILADVRSSPYSGYNPQFNRETMERALKEAGIRYEFLGREFGARRDEPECYVNGRVRFELATRTAAFREGVLRLQDLRNEGSVALMCAERDPLECHRTGMVSRRLKRDVAGILHIREDGSLESQQDLETRLLRKAGLPDRDLFHTREDLVEEAYRWLESRVAYVRVG